MGEGTGVGGKNQDTYQQLVIPNVQVAKCGNLQYVLPQNAFKLHKEPFFIKSGQTLTS